MNKSIGAFLLNIAVAAYLFATGILGLTGRRFLDNNEIRQAVDSLFNGDIVGVLTVVLSILAIAAGAFILMKFFGIEIPVTELLLVVLAVVWVIFIIMMDVVRPLNNSRGTNFLGWLTSISMHLMVLGAILLATERFGGK